MGFFDKLFGPDQTDRAGQFDRPRQESDFATPVRTAVPARDADEIAVERYRYLLRTAPPEAIERAHQEAFEKLTPEQRQMVFRELSDSAPAGEQPRGESAAALAQAATRSELRQPGTLENTFRGPSFGAMVGSSLLGTVAGYVIGSAIVSAFLPPAGDMSAADSGAADSGAADGSADSAAGDTGGDVSASGGDFGGDFGGGDFGGGFGDFGF